MNQNKGARRILAMALSIVMLLGMMPPITAMAAPPIGTSGEIIAFEALNEEMINQEVALGTSLEELDLPETIMATVLVATATDLEEPEEPVQDSGKPAEGTATPSVGAVSGDRHESEESESKNVEPQGEELPDGTEEPGFMEITIPVPVEWVAHPAYDGEAAGVYTFTAEIEDYTVSVPMPQITVAVGEAAEGFITTFAELSEDIRWQRGMSPILPETVEGTVGGETKNIPVTWECETDPKETGLHAFTAKPDENLQLAAGVNPPTIAFMRTSLGRMAGVGTETNPLQITNANQLAEIAAAVNAGKLEEIVTGSASGKVYLKLMNDIDLSAYGINWNDGKGWEPIGHSGSAIFKGSFDGGGYKITGLYIDHTGYDSTGLFGYIDSGAEVKNLGVVGVNITGDNNVGGVAGWVIGTVESCYTTGSVSGESTTGSPHVGGVVGMNYGDIRNCTSGGTVTAYSSAAVSGFTYAGGIAGGSSGSSAKITNCYSIGTITSAAGVQNSAYAGGIAAESVSGAKIENCAALNPSVAANGSPSVCGRIAGSAGGTLTNNYAFSGMMVDGSVTSGSATDENGADKSAADLQVAGGFPSTLTTSPWAYVAGDLPGLFGDTVPLPGHINDTGYVFVGNGSVGDPFLITTAAELARLAELVNAGTAPYAYAGVYYKLMNNIDLSDYGANWNGGNGWVPIGHSSYANFNGIFDGNYKTITGLYIDYTGYNNTGLFGWVGYGAEVKNLGVVGVNIAGDDYTGGVAGRVEDTIENCYSTGNVSGNANVGGVAGFVNGTVENCYSTSSVSGNDRVGGVAGYVNLSGSLENCYSTGSVSSTSNFVGGVVGVAASGGTVENCAALNPSVSGSGNVGRVVGVSSGGILTNNYAFDGMLVNGSVTSGLATDENGADKSAAELQVAGGFPSTLTASPWTYVAGDLPGLFGHTVDMPGHINDSGLHFAGDGSSVNPFKITTAAELAKLAELVNANDATYNASSVYYELMNDIDLSDYGSNWNDNKGWVPIGHSGSATFKGNFDGGGHEITGLYINHTSYDTTGLFGCIDNGAGAENLGVVGVNITGGDCTGGVAGYVFGAVENCYATGTVSGTGSNVGGVAGRVYGRVLNCYSTGSVSGRDHVGGVVGMIGGGMVQNCYSAGSVSGTGKFVGGVAGIVANYGGAKGNAALNPSVSGNSNVGRVAGYRDSTVTYWINYAYSGMDCTSKGADGDDGTPMSAADAVDATFWTDAANSAWSSLYWDIVNGKLPTLKNVGGNQDGDSGLYLTAKSLEHATVTVNGSYTYNGSAYTPTDLTVKFGDTVLIKDVDYEIDTYANNQDAGTATVTVKGIGAYTGTKTKDFTIEKATPNYALPTGLTATYGETLADVSLSAYPEFSWNTPATSVGGATATGRQFFATYTPTDTTNYEIVPDVLIAVVVNKADPAVTWPTLATITYGQPLAQAVFGGEVTNGLGSFAFTDSALKPTVAQSGTTYEMKFAPTDGANYNVLTAGVPITVNKAPAPIIPTQTVKIYYADPSSGNTVDLATLLPATERAAASYSVTSTNTNVTNCSVSPTGLLTFDTVVTTGIGTENITTQVTMANYQTATITVTVEFTDKKVPTVTPHISGSISYGQSLSALVITASATVDGGVTAVPGSIVWDAPSSKPTVGAGAQGWTFTPTDTTLYETVTGSSAITVNKAMPSGTPTITNITQSGKTLADAGLTGSFTNPYDSSAVAGTLAWNDSDSTAVAANTAYNWTFTPSDNANYNSRTGSFTLYRTGGSGGGSSSSNNSTITTWTVTPGKTTDMPTTAVQSDTNQPDSSGQLTMNVTKKMIEDGITEAKKKWSGREAYGIALSFENSAEGTKSLTATIAADALDTLVPQKVKSLTIQCGIMRITLDEKAIASLDSQSTGNVTVTVTPYKVSGAAASAIGTRPVYDITFIDSTGKSISNFGTGTLSIGIAYQTSNAGTGRLCAVYVKSNSEVEWLQNSSYDNGWLMFSRSSLSVYGVGYKPSTAFTDTATHWAKDNIDFAVSRGLFSGTSDTTFSPDTAITRGMFVTALGRLSGADVSSYTTSSFSDVNAGSYYLSYIEWAVKNGIVKGVGDNQFAPDRAITREEMAVIMENYAKVAGYTLPVARQYTAFADDSKISSWAKSAVIATQQAGIINGKDGGRFDPHGSATRAEAATILRRFVELVVDESTALGWVKNDSGQWQYYNWKGQRTIGWLSITGTDTKYYFDKNGIMVTGKWVEISGKWYYFYTDGKLAINTIVDGYTVGADGARN